MLHVIKCFWHTLFGFAFARIPSKAERDKQAVADAQQHVLGSHRD